MSYKYILILFAAALILFPGAAHAQRVFGVHAGLAVPFGTLNDAAGPGFSLSADGFLGFTDRFPNLRAGGRIGYNSFRKQKYPAVNSSASSSAFNVEIIPSLRYVFLQDDNPQEYFLQLGLGAYFTSVSFSNFPGAGDNNSVHLGLQVGGGVTYRLMDNLAVAFTPLYNATTKNYLTLNVGLLYGNREAPITGGSSAYRRR